MSRSFAPLRSVAMAVSRRPAAVAAAAAPRAVPRYAQRWYSTEGSAELSVEELNKKVAELESAKAEAEKKSTDLEAKSKELEVGFSGCEHTRCQVFRTLAPPTCLVQV